MTLAKIELLRDRALMLKTARSFFDQLGITEVDCPILTNFASVDEHIDLIYTSPNLPNTQVRFLHSSPEYGMKRLLTYGMQDIYQLSHVFRAEEVGSRHAPEFMMAEWYRMGISLPEMILETAKFIELFIGPKELEIYSYGQIFEKFAGINPFAATNDELYQFILARQIGHYSSLKSGDRDELLNLILCQLIEPHLPKSKMVAITDYPASQAALAKKKNALDHKVAERFEIYYGGLELANGYHELGDAKEQLLRFQESNEQRQKKHKESLPIDTFFLNDLCNGLPDCCGVAVGFDRLMMLRHSAKEISFVQSFGWHQA